MPSSTVQPPACEVPAAPILGATLPQAAITALWAGQRIEAIKVVRSEQNIGLKEAKEQVDAYIRTQPALMSRIHQAQADAREGLLRWLIFLFAGGVGLTYLLI